MALQGLDINNSEGGSGRENGGRGMLKPPDTVLVLAVHDGIQGMFADPTPDWTLRGWPSCLMDFCTQ
jgi:hypothetical protein